MLLFLLLSSHDCFTVKCFKFLTEAIVNLECRVRVIVRVVPWEGSICTIRTGVATALAVLFALLLQHELIIVQEFIETTPGTRHGGESIKVVWIGFFFFVVVIVITFTRTVTLRIVVTIIGSLTRCGWPFSYW